jgi:hypothetical protein
MEEQTSIPCPYVGLVPYTEEQAAYFFGRERETRLIASKLYAARLTLLYGASGVGKSSVLRAGVAHTLREEDGVAVVFFNVWRADPVAGLRTAVADEVERALAAGREPPEPSLAEATSLGDYLRAAAEHIGPIMLILDQFEEYFLYHPRDGDPESFALQFAKAVNRDDVPASFLISIRQDAYTKLDRFKGRIANLFANYVHLDHLDATAGRAAIEKPIEEYNRDTATKGQQVSIEPALVEAVLEQVKTGQVVFGETGRGGIGITSTAAEERIETAYLQLVMTRVWNQEMSVASPILRLETLHRLGGAQQIVQTHLDTTMKQLTWRERGVAARLFDHLVTPSGTKIAHTATDLASYARVSPEQVEPVLQRLSARDLRLLRPVVAKTTKPSETLYEIFHDAAAPAITEWRSRYLQGQRQRTWIGVALLALVLNQLFFALEMDQMILLSISPALLFALGFLVGRRAK